MIIFSRYCRSPVLLSFELSTAKPKKQKTLYQILQVPTTAAPTSIKKNYLKLAKIYHPDVYKGADKNRFQKIQQAYKTLSDQADRNKYDQTIGIRSSSASDSFQSGQGSNPKASDAYGKPPNDFTYSKPKVQINIDEEYEKFFKKKSTTNFQQIRLHEQNEFKAMSEKERVRRRYTELHGDNKKDWKMKYSKSYNEVLQDQINQKNNYEEDLKKKEKENEVKYSEEGIKFRQRMIKLGGLVVFLLMTPFVISFRTKLQLEKRAKEAYQKKIEDLFAEMQNTQIRSRLRFD